MYADSERSVVLPGMDSFDDVADRDWSGSASSTGCTTRPVSVSLALSVNETTSYQLSLSIDVGKVTSAPVNVSFPADVLQRAARRYNGSYELAFTIHAGEEDRSGFTPPPRNVFAFAQFPCGVVHYLGPASFRRGEQFSSARLFDLLPSRVELFLRRDLCIPSSLSPPTPCELLLKEHIKVILENDEVCGSVAASHIQNLVRELPFYDAATKRHKKWPEWVRHFTEYYHVWSAVVYTEEEHHELGLTDITPAGELRLVANRFRDQHVTADVARDRMKTYALLDYRRLVLLSLPPTQDESDWMSSRDTTATIVVPRKELRKLALSRSFLTLNCANYLQILRQSAEKRVVLFSPLHPVRLDDVVPGACFTRGLSLGPATLPHVDVNQLSIPCQPVRS